MKRSPARTILNLNKFSEYMWNACFVHFISRTKHYSILLWFVFVYGF